MIQQCKQTEPLFWMVQWTGDNLEEIKTFFEDAINFKLLQDCINPEILYIHHDNQIDLATIVVGSYIVKEVLKENFIVMSEQEFNSLYYVIEQE